MEASDCVYGGYYRAGGPQFVGGGQEKKAGGGGGDHFLVEDLLDFSNEEEAEDNGVIGGDDGGFEAEAKAKAKAGNSTGSSTVTAVDSCNSSFSGGGELHFSGDLACLSSDLCEPYEELAELEWLSNFVEEDSFSSEDLQKFQLISGVQSASGPGSASSSSDTPGSSSIDIPSSASPGGKLTAPIQQQPAPLFLPEATAVPGKARSKRSRTAPNNWSSRLLVLCPNAASAASPPSDSDFILLNPNPVRKAPKPGKRREIPPLMAPSDGRRCLHCATDRTPQWRTGPMGPKTLCNACGVRYKSGRLVPEYRPAASPTFVLSRHSNSHRKVLELRRQKDLQQQFVHPGGPGSIIDRLGPDFRQREF